MVTVLIEGWSDHDKIRQVFSADQVETIVLGGNKFDTVAQYRTREAMKHSKVYIMVDPDDAGDIVTKVIQSIYGLPRIVVDPMKARLHRLKGWKYGVEYCTNDYIRELLGGYL